jgi:hypothetical protein
MTRADLYTIALISALPEEHALASLVAHASKLNVSEQQYAVFAQSTEGLTPYDRSPLGENGEQETPTDAEQIAAICTALKAGAEMIVLNRDLIRSVTDELDPPPPEPPVYQTVFDPRDFKKMFPKEVLDAIYTLAITDIQMRQTLDDTFAGPVNVKADEVIDAMGKLLAAELIDQDLHDSILKGKLVA